MASIGVYVCAGVHLIRDRKHDRSVSLFEVLPWREQHAPRLLKKSAEYLPANATLLGISPINSIICAMWSSSLLYLDPA